MQKKSMRSMEEPKNRTCILHQLICPWHYFRSLLPQNIAGITRSRGNICSTTICSSAKIFQQNKSDSWSCVRESLNTQCGCQMMMMMPNVWPFVKLAL
ncbi:hypothetical protein ES288_A04G003600v1 [Gossypium darwinii]|uniref:Uncharacterized protein n=1 Tax=Gossypium darwinii TaxID=34276 RepID=A0A5D2GSK0_GOSDA|nr:hypothetical protein ES288_A04G003600v1 [Gossypium darwinii]